jgi:competence protein ComGC
LKIITSVRDRGAFTLVELLVVIAVLMVLLAILMPSLSRTREVARRAVCASNQHQVGLSLVAYAVENLRRLPNGNATTTPTWGIDSTYRLASNQPLGVAIPYKLGHITKPHIFYCPSWTHPLLQLGVINETTDFAGFAPGDYGGFPVNPGDPAPKASWGISYHYRSSFGTLFNKPPTLVMGGAPPILSDHWVRREALYGVEYGHVEGYNMLRLDGSNHWRSISAERMIQLQPLAFPTNGNWGFQETIWKNTFEN